MIKQTYAIYGMKSEADEAKICDAVRAVYPDIRVSASFHCATMTVILEQPGDDEFDNAIGAVCVAAGFSLHLPCSKSELSDDTAPENVTVKQHKEHKGVSRSVFVASLCSVLVFSILITYAFTANFFGQKIRDLYLSGDHGISGSINGDEEYADLDLLRQLFDVYSVYDLDQDALMEEVLRAYVRATGDEYAVYYTAEELEALFSDNSGEMVGIGVSVVNTVVTIDGADYNLLTVISAYKNSPASEAGIQPGDIIYSVENAEGETVYVDVVGQDEAVNLIRGMEGSEVTLTLLRPRGEGSYETKTLTIERRAIQTHSVEYRRCYADNNIGIVHITGFDMTTPVQFKEAMDDLISQGCDQFIFDLRYNGGGDLQSIIAVLSTMLEKGDVMIYTVDKNEKREVDKVKVTKQTGYYESCSVSEEDIGRYRGYDFVVLTNQYTASAAELFTANLRDYKLATQVGVTTFGKGCMQSILDLSYFGVDGGLRLTTAWYLPPSEKNYHGIGLVPDIEVEMDETLFEKYGNVYLIPDEEDNQLTEAIRVLTEK